ncbi:MAG: carboxypeptidase regulatory-like domain-containing protein [Aridibacter sp.]
MIKMLKITVALTIVLCFSAIAFGQGTTGTIEGTVRDQADAVIPGATVLVESTGSTTGYKRTVTADGNGYFILANVPAGTYTVTISSGNFEPSVINATVVVDRSQVLYPNLRAAGGVTTVNVTADSAVTIDTTSTKIDTNITKAIIDALPKGTTFTSILKIAPNVRPEVLGGGLQIDGASGSENVFVIDGQEVTNFATGTLNTSNNLPFELLQEVQVKSTGFEAEYGGATGGVINAVTSGGNNQWRGNFGISFRPGELQGSPSQTLNGYGSGPGEFDYFDRRKDGGTDFFPVASISGPILKDRIWGLLSYAPQIYETSRIKDYYNTLAPSRNIVNTEQYKARTKVEQAFARVDIQPLSNLRMFGTFLWNPTIVEGELPTSAITRAPAPISVQEYANFGGRVNSNIFNGQATWTPLNWLVLNFRAGRSYLNEKLGAYGRVAGTRFGTSTGSAVDPCAIFPGRTTECRGFNTGSNSLTNFDVSTRTTYDADASFIGLNAGGRHNVKVGYQLNSLYNNVDSGYTSSGYVLLYFGVPITAFTGSNVTPLPSCFNAGLTAIVLTSNCSYGAARFIRIGTFGEASSDNTALYAQDSWQIDNRLTINYGLRIEKEVVPSFGDPATTENIEFGWGDKIAPRVGVAYDPFGDGKTKIFGSYGWFYDRFKYELPRGLFGAETFQDAFSEITPSRGTSPSNYGIGPFLNGRGIIPGGSCPITGTTGFAQCEIDRRVPSNTVGADPFGGAGAVDPDLKAFRQSEYTFGVERQLGSNFVLAGRYTHKQVDRAIEDIGAFNAQGSEAYIIGNPGFGLSCEISMSSNLPCTKAERTYDAVEVRVDKRAAKYFFNASYTWSRLFGNYPGLASSDEFGRNSPNVNRLFDLPLLGYNANGVPDNGLLGTDRPHVFKAYGGYSFDWAGNGINTTNFSAFTTIQSGTPLTTNYSLYSVASAILYGRGDLGRTEMFTETDFSVSHIYKFGRDARFRLEPFVDIRNLFNEHNEIARDIGFGGSNITGTQLTASGCTTCGSETAVFDTIFNRGGIQQFVINYFNANPTRLNNTYNQAFAFQGSRDVRFGAKFRF